MGARHDVWPLQCKMHVQTTTSREQIFRAVFPGAGQPGIGEPELGVGLVLANPTWQLRRGHPGGDLTVASLALRKAKLPDEGRRTLQEVNISILSANGCMALGYGLSIVGLN